MFVLRNPQSNPRRHPQTHFRSCAVQPFKHSKQVLEVGQCSVTAYITSQSSSSTPSLPTPPPTASHPHKTTNLPPTSLIQHTKTKMHFPTTLTLLAITGFSAVLAEPIPNANAAPAPVITNAPGYPAYARSFYTKRQDDGTGEGTGEGTGADDGSGTGADDGTGADAGTGEDDGTCESHVI